MFNKYDCTLLIIIFISITFIFINFRKYPIFMLLLINFIHFHIFALPMLKLIKIVIRFLILITQKKLCSC